MTILTKYFNVKDYFDQRSVQLKDYFNILKDYFSLTYIKCLDPPLTILVINFSFPT